MKNIKYFIETKLGIITVLSFTGLSHPVCPSCSAPSPFGKYWFWYPGRVSDQTILYIPMGPDIRIKLGSMPHQYNVSFTIFSTLGATSQLSAISGICIWIFSNNRNTTGHTKDEGNPVKIWPPHPAFKLIFDFNMCSQCVLFPKT